MYESRLYFVNAPTVNTPNGCHMLLPMVVAEYECCKMPYDFPYLFNAGEKINFNLYVVGCNDRGEEIMVETMLDKYGEHCRMVKPDLVIKYIESHNDELLDYRRTAPLLGLLKGFNMDQWQNLVVVHYGH